MKLGYLHLGEPRHGLHRYGRLLAAEAARRPELGVLERSVALTGDPERDRAWLRDAARALAGADVVHLQWSRTLWGEGWSQLRALRAFVDSCAAPWVVTLHDVHPRDPWRAWRRRGGARRRLRRLRRAWQTRAPGNVAAALLLRRAAAALVCSDVEARRLHLLWPLGRPRPIDHFVEALPPLPARERARGELGLTRERLVVLLGFIHPAKGADLLVDALAHLPPDVHVWLAGAASPGNERYADDLVARADALGAAHRLRITGWLDEDEQARVLAAADLAAAPFRFFSASGSLSTWIAAGRRVLCHDLPQLDRYDALAPGSVARFAPFEAQALARAIQRELALPPEHAVEALRTLREALALPRVFERHLAVYRRAARRPAARAALAGAGAGAGPVG